jgi:hypothetical protein
MLRRSVLYLFRDNASSEERLRLLRYLSFVGLECAAVSASDYGDDVAGGSLRLLEIPPWKRTPRFHARAEGPPSNYDAALHLDFDDEAALAAYEADPVAREIAEYANTVTVGELSARVDWRYDGPVPNRRGGFRHSAMHVWRDEADDDLRGRALGAARALATAPGVEAVAVGESASGRAADFDWILDVRLPDERAALAFLEDEPYSEAAAVVAAATKHEWTARVTHLMRGGPGT